MNHTSPRSRKFDWLQRPQMEKLCLFRQGSLLPDGKWHQLPRAVADDSCPGCSRGTTLMLSILKEPVVATGSRGMFGPHGELSAAADRSSQVGLDGSGALTDAGAGER